MMKLDEPLMIISSFVVILCWLPTSVSFTHTLQLNNVSPPVCHYALSMTSNSAFQGTALANDSPDDISENKLLEKVDGILYSGIEYLKLQQLQEVTLAKVDASFATDVDFCASFGREEGSRNVGDSKITKMPPTYEWVNKKESKHTSARAHTGDGIAVRTIAQPLLDKSSISIIREAAQTWWHSAKSEQEQESSDLSTATKSRFSYQRKGNYEAHLVDLANHVDGRINTIVQDTLRDKIYPLVKDAFHSLIPDLENLNLCVYDSLVIRYNSTEAKLGNQESNFLGASQPLHRDLGLVSVNIMLNSECEFEGGGTFFENQLQNHIITHHEASTLIPSPKPLKPLGPGHALAHLSSERHAGVGTTDGVRDILVLFLTARSNSSSTPVVEKAARLKTSAREICTQNEALENSILCRIMHHRLALIYVPTDGEAWHYLGTALHEYAKVSSSLDIMMLSTSCLEHAVKLIPCDGRLCNNLGLAFESLLSFEDNVDYNYKDQTHHELVEKYYERSISIHKLSEIAGCDVRTDFDATSLNYGLYISFRNEFDRGAKILSRLRSRKEDLKNDNVVDSSEGRIISDGIRLLEFCESQG